MLVVPLLAVFLLVVFRLRRCFGRLAVFLLVAFRL
jgi:hypothetical protein